MTVTLAHLLEGNPPLEVARPSESVAAAMERMREHDYSQLPVVDEDATELRAIGLISTAMVARTSMILDIPPSKLKVHHVYDRHPLQRKLDDDLWRTLDAVRSGEVLLVEDHDAILRGILTGQDFTTYLRRQSEDSITVLDIEHTVKQLILDKYREDEAQLRAVVERELGVQHRSLEKSVRAIVNRCLSAVSVNPGTLDAPVFVEVFQKQLPDRGIYEFDRLSFHQYQQILLGDSCWPAYEQDFDLPREHLRALLDVARELRNQIMHNRGLPTPAERAKLGYCRELLSRVADRRQDAATVTTATEVEPPATAVDDHASLDERPTIVAEVAGSDLVIWSWLDELGKDQDRVTLSFDDIDGHTHNALPAAAREHRSWWTNDEEAPQSAQWLDVSWRIVSVNLSAGTATFGRNTGSEQACIAIFGALFRQLAEHPSWAHETPSPAGRTWQTIRTVTVDGSSVQLSLGFTSGERFRISIYIDAADPRLSKATYDRLAAHRDDIERRLGTTLSWERKPHRRASRVSLVYQRDISIRSPESAIEQLAEWVREFVPQVWAAVTSCLGAAE